MPEKHRRVIKEKKEREKETKIDDPLRHWERQKN
jgi:hypothetical protein